MRCPVASTRAHLAAAGRSFPEGEWRPAAAHQARSRASNRWSEGDGTEGRWLLDSRGTVRVSLRRGAGDRPETTDE